jgi:hypothetical protein
MVDRMTHASYAWFALTPRFVEAMRGVVGKRLEYKALIGAAE